MLYDINLSPFIFLYIHVSVISKRSIRSQFAPPFRLPRGKLGQMLVDSTPPSLVFPEASVWVAPGEAALCQVYFLVTLTIYARYAHT